MSGTPEFNIPVFSFLLNLAWEYWQVPFFRGMADQPHWLGVKACSLATLGDAGIALAAFWVRQFSRRTGAGFCEQDDVRLRGQMKRILFIFLLCLFPLQASLASVAEYCEHEPPAAQASHPGHHEHEHQKSPEPAPDPFPQADLDCAHHWSPVPVPSSLAAGMLDSHWSYFLDHPTDFQSALLHPSEHPPRLTCA